MLRLCLWTVIIHKNEGTSLLLSKELCFKVGEQHDFSAQTGNKKLQFIILLYYCWSSQAALFVQCQPFALQTCASDVLVDCIWSLLASNLAKMQADSWLSRWGRWDKIMECTWVALFKIRNVVLDILENGAVAWWFIACCGWSMTCPARDEKEL